MGDGDVGSFAWPIRAGVKFIGEPTAEPTAEEPPRPAAAIQGSGTVDRDPQAAVARAAAAGFADSSRTGWIRPRLLSSSNRGQGGGVDGDMTIGADRNPSMSISIGTFSHVGGDNCIGVSCAPNTVRSRGLELPRSSKSSALYY